MTLLLNVPEHFANSAESAGEEKRNDFGHYITLADLLNNAAKTINSRRALAGAGDSFCAGKRIEDFLRPAWARQSPQAELIEALINFDSPFRRGAGAAIGRWNHPANSLRLVSQARTQNSKCLVISLCRRSIELIQSRANRIPRAAELVLLGYRSMRKRAAELV